MSTKTPEQFDEALALANDLPSIAALQREVRGYLKGIEPYPDWARQQRYYGWLGALAEKAARIQDQLDAEESATPPPPPAEIPSSAIIPVTGDPATGEWIEGAS